MLCEKCKKRTATVFYNENMNGKVRSYSLCGECAAKLREKGEIQDITSMSGSFADPFSELQDHFFSGFFGISPQKELRAERKCPSCGTVYPEIAKSGKVGCPECYTVFADELSRLIRSVHGTTSHIGSIPARQRAILERSETLKALREQQREAVKREDYETAAKLRDEIRSLEQSEEKEEN